MAWHSVRLLPSRQCPHRLRSVRKQSLQEEQERGGRGRGERGVEGGKCVGLALGALAADTDCVAIGDGACTRGARGEE